MSTKPLDVDGVDISHHQAGALDLPGAKRRGLKWLYHKATEGTSFRDSNYPRRREEARKAGIPFGAYHFARADRGDAAAEARFFLDYAKPKPGDLRPALDLETTEGLSSSELRAWAATFIRVVTKAVDCKPIVYTPYELGEVTDGCLLWRPRYNNDNRPPVLDDWDIWQFSNGVFGVPNRLAGVGAVDLNVMREGLTVRAMRIPKHDDPDVDPPKPPRETRVVRMGHASMQFGDSNAQQREDAEAIFGRAEDRNWSWVTGTEAGPGAHGLEDRLKAAANDVGFKFFKPKAPTDCWIAVRRSLVKKGSWDSGYDPVIPGSGALYEAQGLSRDLQPRWGPKGLVWVSFDNDELGHISIGSAHYLTGARFPGPSSVEKGIDHWAWNRKLGLYIGDWAIRTGKGQALTFYGGDQNMADQRNDQAQGDTFFGKPLTSLGDELGKWPNTGHGPIDVIATYDADGRVTAKGWRALNDKRFPLHTDHFLTEGEVEVRLLKG